MTAKLRHSNNVSVVKFSDQRVKLMSQLRRLVATFIEYANIIFLSEFFHEVAFNNGIIKIDC